MARPRSSAILRFLSVFAALIVLGGLAFAGVQLKGRFDRAQATPRAKAHWAKVQPQLVSRLRQGEPLELGAVWMTHAGRICGLVNGRGSFGGLTGMTPFYADASGVSFASDTSELAFAPSWKACLEDEFVTVVRGSYERGFCGTKLGQAKCVDYGTAH